MHYRTEKPLRYDGLSGFYVLEFGFVIDWQRLFAGFLRLFASFPRLFANYST
jgi:hypothetical protein